MRIVYVVWADSHGCHDRWTDFSDLEHSNLPVCYSVGMVMQENDDIIVLVPHWYLEPDPNGMGEMCIPKRAIVSTQVLKDDGVDTGQATDEA